MQVFYHSCEGDMEAVTSVAGRLSHCLYVKLADHEAAVEFALAQLKRSKAQLRKAKSDLRERDRSVKHLQRELNRGRS